MGEAPSRVTRIASLLLLAVGFLVCGGLWSVVAPSFEKPDEIHHLAVVEFLVRERRLPVMAQETAPFLDPEADQPPLYYALAAVAHSMARSLGVTPMQLEPWEQRVNRRYAANPTDLEQSTFWLHGALAGLPDAPRASELLFGRLLNVVTSLATVLTTYLIGMVVLDKHHWLALSAAALVAFLPQFTFISASVNNDPMSWAVAAVYVLLLLRLIDAPAHRLRRDLLLLGCLMGLALLTKLTLACLAPLVLLARPRSVSTRQWRSGLVLWAIAALTISGWWFVRNVQLYQDPLARQELVSPDLYEWNLAPKTLLSPYFRGVFWSMAVKSTIGLFGFIDIAMPAQIYRAAGIVAGAAALGLMRHVLRLAKEGRLRRGGAAARLAIVGTLPLLVLAALVFYNLSVSQPQGRYLFAALPGVAVLVVLGLDELAKPLGSWAETRLERYNGRRLSRLLLSAVLITGIVALNVYALVAVVAPAYGPLAWSLLDGL